MTDHKLTDEEVIKALESKVEAHCTVCDTKEIVPCEHCIFHYIKHAVALINRQKAEIERLTTLAELGRTRANDYRAMRDKAKNARAEAIKEFAERLKEKAYIPKPYGAAKVVDEYAVDDLVKEMTEGKDHENISD